ncbi:MAG: hypothetical protein K0R05_1938 [Anaerocolumna sp.]|jgi:hypothetical protein|nr:hypothetical protein [Anaerocolumna sp.]
MKKAIRRITAVIIVIALLFGLQRLVTPKYMDDILEGSFIGEYYKEKPEHDVIMIGDCEVYENFSPITLWEQYGITSFIRGSAQQLVWQSYYLLEDTLRYETPEVVVFNVLALKYNEPQREEYNRMSIDGMKWSAAKWKNIKASMTEEEKALDYVFPILRFHSRITQLTKSDFQYYLEKRKVTHNGYYMRVDIEPVEDLDLYAEEEPDTLEIGENAMNYMDKIKDLCEKKGIKLVLVKAPSISPVWYDEYEDQMIEYAAANNLPYINYLDLVEELGIDYTKDTYDAGLHMNLSGAEKLSNHLGGFLQSSYNLKDHREDEKLKKLWDEKIEFYNNMKAAQYKELEDYGYLKSYGGESEE